MRDYRDKYIWERELNFFMTHACLHTHKICERDSERGMLYMRSHNYHLMTNCPITSLTLS